MADYLIQDTTLDAIADAINAKTGESSAMTPAEMVTAIGSISGGGLPTPITAIKTGSFTLAEDVTSYELTHALGVMPQLIFVWCEGFTDALRDYNKSKTNMIVASAVGSRTDIKNWFYAYRYSSSGGNMSSGTVTYAENDVTSQIFKIHAAGTLGATLTTFNGTSPATWRWLALAVSS